MSSVHLRIDNTTLTPNVVVRRDHERREHAGECGAETMHWTHVGQSQREEVRIALLRAQNRRGINRGETACG